MSIDPLTPRQPVSPLQRPAPLSRKPQEEKEEKDTAALEQEKQSIQKQLILLKGTTDTATSPDVEKALNGRLE